MIFPARPTATGHNRMIPARRAFVVALPALLPALLIAGCAGTKPLAYSGIASTKQMRPDPRSDRLPYSFSIPVDWQRYEKIIVEPVRIYDGADAQFGKISVSDQHVLADDMKERFAASLSERFVLVRQPKARTLRLRLTLTGARTTAAVTGSLSRIDLVGAPYNIVQAVRGKEGSMTGSVFYVVEIFDAMTNRLLMAQIVKQYPAALNIKATFGALTAAKTGIAKGAEDLLNQLDSPPRPSAKVMSEEATDDPDASPMMAEKTILPVYPLCGAGRVDGCRQRDIR